MLHYEHAQEGRADEGEPAGTEECALLQKSKDWFQAGFIEGIGRVLCVYLINITSIYP